MYPCDGVGCSKKSVVYCGQTEKRMWEVLTGTRLRFCLTTPLPESFLTLSGQKVEGYDVANVLGQAKRPIPRFWYRGSDDGVMVLHRLLLLGTVADTKNNPCPYAGLVAQICQLDVNPLSHRKDLPSALILSHRRQLPTN
jgi:hypothetical protein